MSDLLHDFAQRRARGAEVLDALAERLQGTGLDVAAAATDLRGLAERARSGRFHVILVGCFSSGKSTLLNAIVGEPVLPMKVNPCTAILTELVYGEAPQVEVRQRGGDGRTMDVPTFLHEFQLRTAEVAEAGQQATDRFGDVDRAVLSYPLDLLKDGVVVVDTPGLDDDDTRTARTLASLPEADAVIVVLNASRFLTDLERRILRQELLPRGLTNLFFPVTMIDLLESLSDDPARERRETTERARKALGPLCTIDGQDRFAERFFPLDARSGLHARWDRAAGRRKAPADEAALASSGLAAFETALQSFLVNERGRAQMNHLLATAKRVRGDLVRRADLDRATADATAEELRRRQEELAPKFAELDAIARRVARTVDGFVTRQQTAVWQDLRSFLARTEQELPEAVARFDLGNLAGFDLLTPSGRERIEARIREQLEAWLADRVAAWQADARPRLEQALAHLREELAGDAEDFDTVVQGIVADFAGGVIALPSEDADRDEPGAVERWFSVAVGAVLLSPGTMAAGWAEGYEGALKGATGRLGVRLALLALGVALGPIGWAGLLLYAVSDAVLLAITGGGQLERLRKSVAEGLKGKLVAQADEARSAIAEKVAEALGPLREGIVAAAHAEARQLEAQLEQTVAAREEAARDASDRAAAWEAALGALDASVAELEDLAR